jgi:hypothetical protein
MKQTYIQAFAVILIGSLLTASCKKDETTPANSFKYNSKESAIGSAFAGILGEISDGTYGYYVYFLENTLTVHYDNSSIDSISGIGDLLEIAMVSADSAGIKPGVYNFSSSQTTFDPFTFGYESGLLINFDYTSETPPTMLYFSGGKITVVKNGDIYEVTLSITTTANTTITGFYKGGIEVYQMGKKASSRNPFSFPLFK